MILLDANLLIYAHVKDFAEHESANRWLDERLNGTDRVGLPWPSLLAFVRLVTNPRVFNAPESIEAAWNQVEAWLTLPSVWVPDPTSQHATILGQLMRQSVTRSALVPDAHLAALAIEHGLILCSTDGDFARFSGLRWQNPLRPDE